MKTFALWGMAALGLAAGIAVAQLSKDRRPPLEREQDQMRRRGVTVRSLKHDDGSVEYQGFIKGAGWITYGFGFGPMTLKPGESARLPVQINLKTGRMEHSTR